MQPSHLVGAFQVDHARTMLKDPVVILELFVVGVTRSGVFALDPDLADEMAAQLHSGARAARERHG